MKINVTDIREDLGAFKEINLEQEFDDIKSQGHEFKVVEPAEINLQVFNTDESFLVTGSIDLKFEVACSRCLDKFELPLTVKLEEEIDREDVEMINNQSMIDITKEIDDNVMVSLPMKPVCDDDCAGLCSNCGQNLNEADCECFMHTVDPRLAKLEKLLD
ncbi:MAG: YceD family protein [Bacillota bacterium]